MSNGEDMINRLIARLIKKTSLKTEVDKLDIDKLTPVPNDLAKLNNE